MVLLWLLTAFVIGRVAGVQLQRLWRRLKVTARSRGLLFSPLTRDVTFPALGGVFAGLVLAAKPRGSWDYLLLAALAPLVMVVGALTTVRDNRPPEGSTALPSGLQQDQPLSPLLPTLLSEAPVETFPDDLLDRESFIDQWIDEIRALRKDRQYVYALVGKQGEGKTSAIRLLAARIRARNLASELLVLRFDPWLFAGADALSDGFYNLLDRSLNEVYFLPDLSHLLRRHRELVQTGAAVIGLAGVELPTGSDSLRLKDRIASRLARLPLRVLLLVDDIDRLTGDELTALFRMVRLTAEFPNLVTVLCYDEDKLELEGSRRAGLREKLVDQLKPLPPAPARLIERFVYWSDAPEPGSPQRLSTLDRLLPEWGMDEGARKLLESELTRPTYDDTLGRGLTSMRSAKRYLRSIASSLPPLLREVNLMDFLLLEYLKVFEPRIWRTVWDRPELFVEGLSYSLIEELLHGSKAEGKLLAQEIRKLLGGATRPEITQKILTAVFGRVAAALGDSRVYRGEAARNLRAESSFHFSKYFRLAVEKEDVPDHTIRSMIARASESPDATAIWTEEIERFRASKLLARLFEKLGSYVSELPDPVAGSLAAAIATARRAFRTTGPWDSSSELTRGRMLIQDILDRRPAAGAAEFVSGMAGRIDDEVLIIELVHSIEGKDRREATTVFAAASATLKEVFLARAAARYANGHEDVFVARQGWASHIIYVWVEWGGREAPRAYLGWLIDQNPDLLQRLINSFWRVETGKVDLAVIDKVIGIEWLLEKGAENARHPASPELRGLMDELRQAH